MLSTCFKILSSSSVREAVWFQVLLYGGLCCIVLYSIPFKAVADSDIDGGIAYLSWWSYNANPMDSSFDSGSLDEDTEFQWLYPWGLQGNLYKPGVGNEGFAKRSDLLSFSFKRPIRSRTGNSFLALGLGWENVEAGRSLDTSGARLLLQGKLGLTPLLSLYGHTAWLPGLEDSEQLQNPDGLELEAGFSVKPLPNISFRAGYREFRVDFKSLEGANESARSKGVMFGAGINF